MSLFVFFISLLIVAQHVSGNHVPIPGLNSGGSDIRDWDVVASGPVVLSPLSQGIVVGKLRGRSILEVLREIWVEPIGIGTPGAYVARVVSRVYTREEIDGLSNLGKGQKVNQVPVELKVKKCMLTGLAGLVKNCHYRPVKATPPAIAS